MRTLETDVLVIGSGFGGAAPALRLARAGLRVQVVEKGPRLDPVSDFRRTQDPKYLLRFLKGVPGEHLDLTFAEALGGGSAFFEMVCLRAPSRAFEQVDERGARLWPRGVDRAALDPYYQLAERMLEVEQIPAEEVPRTGLVFALMMKNLGYHCERARYAVKGCVGTGYCIAGCTVGAKRSLLENYLPQAIEAGANVATDLEADSIRPLVDARRAPRSGPIGSIPYRYQVSCRSRVGGEAVHLRARLVVLAGGTVDTAALLLRSKAHLPLLSPHLGRHIAFNGSVKAAGLLAEGLPDVDNYTGRSHPGMVSYQFLDSHDTMVTAAKALPIQVATAARLRLEGSGTLEYFGRPAVERMREFRHRTIVLAAFGLTPPSARLEVSADGSARMALESAPWWRSYHRRTVELLHSILRGNGCSTLVLDFVNSEGRPYRDVHFSSAHQVGSCRMADSAERGVVDATGEVFGHPGLFVTDGAAIPSSLAVNTALTILANAERIAAHLVGRFPAREAVVAERRP
jgi:choline dehydrogenase-like flavoprotein